MTTGRDQLIRDRAYAIWVSEGSPEGRDRVHWEQACREIDEAAADAPTDAAAPESVAEPVAEPEASAVAATPRARRARTPALATSETAAAPRSGRRRPG